MNNHLKNHFPDFFNEFTPFQTLLETSFYRSPFHDLSLTMNENLFSGSTITVQQAGETNVFIFLTDDLKQTSITASMLVSLLEILINEEIYLLFSHSIPNKHLLDESYLNTLLAKKNIELPHIVDRFLELEPFFYNENHASSYKLSELKENPEIIFSINSFDVFISNDFFEEIIENISKNKTIRLQVITGAIKHPNQTVFEEISNIFSLNQAIEFFLDANNSSKHYSKLEDNIYAFNIKVHDSFVNQELYEKKILNDDDEQENREQALSDFLFACIQDPIISNFFVDSLGTTGRSGGYLLLELQQPTKECIARIDELISQFKTSSPAYYQSIEPYLDMIES